MSSRRTNKAQLCSWDYKWSC